MPADGGSNSADSRSPSNDSGAAKELMELLDRAVCNTPIPEHKIQATLRTALARKASRRRIRGTLAAAGLLLLAAATVWHWSGQNSEAELDFATALSITRGHGGYEQRQVQAASGKVYRDAHKLLVLLHERDAVSPAMQLAVANTLAGTPPPITYTHGLESVMAKLRSGQSLSPSDEATALAAVCAAASAIRELRQHQPELAPLTDRLLRFLDADLRQADEPATPDRSPGNRDRQR